VDALAPTSTTLAKILIAMDGFQAVRERAFTFAGYLDK